MSEIGDRVKIVRTNLKLKQDEFALSIDVSSPNTIYRWETGKAFPPADVLALIHEKYGVNIHWLVTGEGEMFLPDRGPVSSPGVGGGAPEHAMIMDRVSEKICGEIIHEIVYKISASEQQLGVTLSPKKRASAAAALYDVTVTKGKINDMLMKKILELIIE